MPQAPTLALEKIDCGGGMVPLLCGGRAQCGIPPARCCWGAVCGEGGTCSSDPRNPCIWSMQDDDMEIRNYSPAAVDRIRKKFNEEYVASKKPVYSVAARGICGDDSVRFTEQLGTTCGNGTERAQLHLSVQCVQRGGLGGFDFLGCKRLYPK